MQLKLDSDFRDFYDTAFDLTGESFVRQSRSGMARPEMLQFLERKWFAVPRHGSVCEVAPKVVADSPGAELVVYLDETAHAGSGKIKVPAAQALIEYPGHYCSEYLVPVCAGPATSIRYLQVGMRSWQLRYTSDNDWRSNVGAGDVTVLREGNPGYSHICPAPLFAIDLVDLAGRYYAVDFNIAPSLMPLRDLVTPSEVVQLIKTALADQQR